MKIQYEQTGDLWVHPEYRSLLEQNNLCTFDELLCLASSGSLNKKGLPAWRERTVLTLNCSAGPRKFYLKRYFNPPVRQQLRRWFAGLASTAEAEWRWLQATPELDIAVPPAVAYGGRRRWFWESASLLLTEEIPGESLEKWLPRVVSTQHIDRAAMNNLGVRLARLVAALHHAGVAHRDLYLSHIFVQEVGNGDYQLFLIDLQRMIAPRWRLQRWIVKDLAALNYSTPQSAGTLTDRVRWLKSYLGISKLRASNKALIKTIALKTEKIARHSMKHGLG